MPDDREPAGDQEIDGLDEAFLREFGLAHVTCSACARAHLPAPFNLESYSYTPRGGPTWTWDIAFARSLVARRRPPAVAMRIDAGEVIHWIEQHGHIDQQHVAHIPADRLDEPVLLAPAPDGQGQIVIDGSHRATARVRAGLPVLAYLLTDQESALAIAVVPLAMGSVYRALCARGLLPHDLDR